MPASAFQFQLRLHNIPQKCTPTSMFQHISFLLLMFGLMLSILKVGHTSPFLQKTTFFSTYYSVTGGSIPGGFAGTSGRNSKWGEVICTRLRQRCGSPLSVSAASPGRAPCPAQVWTTNTAPVEKAKWCYQKFKSFRCKQGPVLTTPQNHSKESCWMLKKTKK